MPGIELSRLLAGCRRIVALTGAGCSTPSGIPDYRDAAGNWKQPHPVLFPDFVRSPEVRRRYWARSALGWPRFERASPNAAHRALAELEDRGLLSGVITQNVDGLHQRAGSERVVELHGNITRVRCSREGTVVARWDSGSAGAPPRCPQCGAPLRPDVVWFEEPLPAGALAAAEDAARRCDVLIVAGTSAAVYPAAALPESARRRGARVVEVNPNETPLSAHADDVLRGPAGVVLPALVAAAFPDR